MTGKVKWYRWNDGTGYIDGDDGVKYYFDDSVTAKPLCAGNAVTFTPVMILGRACALGAHKQGGAK